MLVVDIGPGLASLLALTVTTAGGLLTLWINHKFKLAEKSTAEIHTLVNSRLTNLLMEKAEFKRIIKTLLDAAHHTIDKQELDREIARDIVKEKPDV